MLVGDGAERMEGMGTPPIIMEGAVTGEGLRLTKTAISPGHCSARRPGTATSYPWDVAAVAFNIVGTNTRIRMRRRLGEWNAAYRVTPAAETLHFSEWRWLKTRL